MFSLSLQGHSNGKKGTSLCIHTFLNMPIVLDMYLFVESWEGNVVKSGVTVEVGEDEWLHDGGHQHHLSCLDTNDGQVD
jgi:hypothetical protein